MKCELKDEKTRILVFSSFSAEISELKDEKTRMHNVHPGSHPLSSSRLAGIAYWLTGPFKVHLIRPCNGPYTALGRAI